MPLMRLFTISNSRPSCFVPARPASAHQYRLGNSLTTRRILGVALGAPSKDCPPPGAAQIDDLHGWKGRVTTQNLVKFATRSLQVLPTLHHQGPYNACPRSYTFCADHGNGGQPRQDFDVEMLRGATKWSATLNLELRLPGCKPTAGFSHAPLVILIRFV